MIRNNHILPLPILQRVAGYRSHALWALLLLAVLVGASMPARAIEQVDGVYQIASAQDLRDFATLVNGGTTGANAVLTRDIDLGGEVEFPNIGKTYTGTFDGQGYTISGFLRSTNANTNNAAFFNTTNNATIKRFTLNGKMVCTGLNVWGVASVVGYAQGTTKIEDVTSSVEMTFKNCTVGTGQSGLRIVGGIAGRAAGTINRCRFNGTMDFSESEGIGDRIGGICANPNGVTISNCLFDGTIITNCTKDLHVVGGITGQNNGNGSNPITNCLSKGTFTFAEGAKTTNCGAICGVKVACTNCYNNSNIEANTSSGATEVGTTPWSTITDNLNGGASVTACNWKVVSGQAWPIPKAWTKTVYTITFVDYDGTKLDIQYIEAGSDLTTPANPSRTGYTFTGWSPTVVTTPTADATYTAQYDINEYTIKFNTNGGDPIADETKDYNTEITLPTAVKTGYRFDAWNVAQDGLGTSYDGGAKYTITADATLYAQYTINQYTITFDTDGGTSIAPITQDYGTTITAPANPTKVGYTFAGWNKTIPSTMPAENITITATWTINQHTITFDTKGGTAIAPITQDYGTTITAPANPEKAHYRFDGWDKTIPATMPDEDMTITATYSYVPNAENVYEIGSKEDFFNFVTIASTNASANAKLVDNIDLQEESFNGFGTSTTGYKGTFDGNKKTISGYKRTFTSGNNSLGFFNKTEGATINDLTLVGDVEYNINTACYAIGGVIGMANSTTIEGVTSKVKMTFGANCPSGTGGIRVVGGIVGRISGGSINKCRYNGTIDLSANSGISERFGGIVGDLGSASTISNCLFDGEIKVAATSSLLMGGILGGKNSQTPTIQHCLFNGKMTFPVGADVSNCGPISGGTGVTASDSYYDMTGFTVKGVTQAKTAVQQSGSIEHTTQPWIDVCVALNNGSSNWGIETETYPVPGDHVAATYTITFNTDGGSEVASITLPAGAAITAPENPTKTGWTFTGWSPELPLTMPANNLTVTAQWTRATFNVNYYVDNVLTYTDPFEYEATITPHAAPSKPRYTFSGWSDIPATMPANDVRVDGTFTYSANTSGVYEIGNREDYVNFVTATKTNAAANAKVIANIDLNNEAVDGIGNSTTPYTGTFDGNGKTISGYVRNVTTYTNQGGMFNYVGSGATVKNFSLAGTMTVSCANGQQYGSVIGYSGPDATIEDIHSSVNVNITSTAAQVGGFVGRAGGTYNRCRYSGTVSTSTAFNKIGGFAGGILAGTLKNCLFDGTLTVSTDNANLMAGGFMGSSIETNPHTIQNCLIHGTMNITHPSDSCGVINGYAENVLTLSQVYYTPCAGVNRVMGAVKGTMTGAATPKGSLTWEQICFALNPAEGTSGNWEIKTGEGEVEYPVPSTCTIVEHVHNYVNGFCLAGDAYEPADKDIEGWYEVDKAGKLWWIATKLNDGTLPKTALIKLTDNINMEGEQHGSWPGICVQTGNDWTTAFQGTFDGQGHTISNYYSNVTGSGCYRRGMFNTVYNAIIRHFNIKGTMTANSGTTLTGVVIGSASGTTTIEDINCSVNIKVAGAGGVGGIVGGLENANNPITTMNRCRYNGKITITGTSGNNGVGGLIGNLRSAIVKNCLFDGTITAATGVSYSNVGGIVGAVNVSNNSEIHRSLSHGTIKLTDYTYSDSGTCGASVGSASTTLYLYKCYHTTTNCSGGMTYIGNHIANKDVKNEDTGVTENIPVDQLLGTSIDKTSSVADLKTDAFRTLMGEPNWTYANSQYVYPLKDESHIHKYHNGFCTAGDGEYEKPNSMGTIYQIYNGGQLYWFATQFNDKKIPQNATVEIMRDIDMESDNYIYPGIGTSDYRFKGTFAGHNYKIQRYYRDIVNAEGTGLINYAIGATIKEFSIYGTTNFNLAGIKSFHGTVLGMGINGTEPADTMLISDVFSFVNVNCSNANVRVLGGIAGRTSGGLKRSRYSGIIKGMGTQESDANYASASGRQIGGLIANAREKILIEDCLFDGKIYVTCQEADTMRVSGILASNEKNSGVKITIKNCLFNGCLKLKHTYVQGTHGTGVKSTENGIIAGYWDSNLPKFVNNVYYLKTCEGMDDINIGYWEGKNQQTGSSVTINEIETTPTKEEWNEIFKKLDEYNEVTGERNNNWVYDVENAGSGNNESLPVPGGHKCDHKLEDGSDAYDEFGYCTICNTPRPLVADDDGKYKMELVSDLASFRDMVNDGDLTEGTVLNAKLTADIDFSKFKDADGNYKDFGEPIGNSNFNRYLYNFDGQGHALLNVKIKTDDQYVGFFGFAGDETHDCHIHDLTITGEIEVPYDSKLNDDKPMYMGVVGKMYRGKIENVHSQLTMKNTSATRAMIGGILGCAETAADQEVIISKCSYIGTCEADAVGSIGGIVGETSKNTKVENCTFAGTLYHKYTGDNNTTQFGGIVGRNTEESFQGVKNCVVVGILNTTKAASEFKEYGTPGNHKNALVGEDEYMNSLAGTTQNTYRQKFSNNYALAAYEPLIPKNSQVKPTFYSIDHFISGRVCAELNARDHSLDLNYATYGLPFGQILGYQTGENKDTLSTADAIPFPGYRDPDKKTYRVTKDASNNYTVDYYFFDDLGDTTPMPSDMASMAVKKIDYSRGGSASNAEYDMSGYNSFCLPFDFTYDMLPADAKCYTFKEVDGTDVKFSEITQFPIAKGTPFIMYCMDNTPKWSYNVNNSFGTEVVLKSDTFDDGASTVNNIPDAPGLYGVFNTKLIGPGFYKVKGDGSKLVKTNDSSHCYPFRCYLKLPTSGGAKDYVPVFEDAASGIKAVTTSSEADGPRYNVMGQRVGKNAKGIVIVGGRKTLIVTK